MKKFLFGCMLSAMTFCMADTTSITDGMNEYKTHCLQAACSDAIFSHFKTEYVYQNVVEWSSFPRGMAFCEYIHNNYPELISRADLCRRNDEYGGPATHQFPGLGKFSPSTLCYMSIAADINKMFTFEKSPRIVEIGGGYGGQCYLMSMIRPFSEYAIYDLIEVLPLQNKYLQLLGVKNFHLCPPDALPADPSFDLVISNYALSECSREMQFLYLNEIVRHAKRGYLILNDFSALKLEEYVEFLEENGITPSVQKENVEIAKANYLVTWGYYER